MLTALALMFSLCIPAFAADLEGFSFNFLGRTELDRDGISPRLKENYAFDIPGNGKYYTVERVLSLDKGDTVGVTGTWYPANASVWIEFLKEDGSGEAVAVSLRSGQSADLPIGSTGTYSLRMMSSDYDVNGTLQIEW